MFGLTKMKNVRYDLACPLFFYLTRAYKMIDFILNMNDTQSSTTSPISMNNISMSCNTYFESIVWILMPSNMRNLSMLADIPYYYSFE
jgi:hypothetical protein